MADQEQAICAFCGEVKSVQRQYLHAKNKEHIDENNHTPFTIIYYCNDCGCAESEILNKYIININIK